MDYKIPDFLLTPLAPEESQKFQRQNEIEKKYYETFPETRHFQHCLEGVCMEDDNYDRYYECLEECIRKGIMMDDLHPEYGVWTKEEEEEDVII